MRKKNADRGISLTDFRLYYKAILIKTIWFCHKNKNTPKQNRIETPEINPCTHEYLIFEKGGRNIQWRKKSLLAGETGQLHVRE